VRAPRLKVRGWWEPRLGAELLGAPCVHSGPGAFLPWAGEGLLYPGLGGLLYPGPWAPLPWAVGSSTLGRGLLYPGPWAPLPCAVGSSTLGRGLLYPGPWAPLPWAVGSSTLGRGKGSSTLGLQVANRSAGEIRAMCVLPRLKVRGWWEPRLGAELLGAPSVHSGPGAPLPWAGEGLLDPGLGGLLYPGPWAPLPWAVGRAPLPWAYRSPIGPRARSGPCACRLKVRGWWEPRLGAELVVGGIFCTLWAGEGLLYPGPGKGSSTLGRGGSSTLGRGGSSTLTLGRGLLYPDPGPWAPLPWAGGRAPLPWAGGRAPLPWAVGLRMGGGHPAHPVPEKMVGGKRKAGGKSKEA